MTASLPALAFSGPSGSGKTTLLEKLVVAISARGVRVGAIKRSHHMVDIDREGKDSYRFREAGANPVMIVSDGFIGYMEKLTAPADLKMLIGQFEGKTDIVLVEGFKGESIPRFVFVVDGNFPEMNDDITGFIVDDTASGENMEGKPVFHRDNADGVAEWIIARLSEKRL